MAEVRLRSCAVAAFPAVGAAAAAHPLDDEVVVTAAQTTVTGEHHQQHSLHGAHLTQWAVNILNTQTLVHTVKNLEQAIYKTSEHKCCSTGTAAVGDVQQAYSLQQSTGNTCCCVRHMPVWLLLT